MWAFVILLNWPQRSILTTSCKIAIFRRAPVPGCFGAEVSQGISALFICRVNGGEKSKVATTRIMPLHTGKGRTVRRAIRDIIGYVKNPEKTDDGRLVTSYACDSRTADAEFLLAKRQYIAATGRVRGKDDVIAYHLRQSFVPGEITAEEANRLGVEMARRQSRFYRLHPYRQGSYSQSYHLERSQPGLRPEVPQFLGQHPCGAAAQ